MKKYFSIAVLTLLVVGLVSGSAFAAATLNAGNTSIASELVPPTGLLLSSVNTGYEPAGAVAATSQIKITLQNGTFAAGAIDLCDTLGNPYLAAPVATVAGSSSVTLVTNTPLTSGNVYNLQPAACVAGVVPLNNINIGPGAGAGTVVSMVVDNALAPGDTNIYATAPIITLKNQLSAVVITPAIDTLDFNTTPTMAQFLPGGSGTATTSVAKLVILSDENMGTPLATGLAGNNAICAAFAGNAADTLALAATPGGGATTMGTGLNPATLDAFTANATILKAAIAATDTSAAGTAAMGALVNICGIGAPAATQVANAASMTLKVEGATTLSARTYNLAVATTTAGDIVASPRTIMAATTAWTWKMNASQYYIPLVGSNAGSGRETYIKLQSKNTVAGANGVAVSILAKDGSTVATYTSSITAGTPLVITGTQLKAAALAAGKSVDGTAGFAVIVNVNAPERDVFIYANMLDAAGAKRIPVKTVDGTIVE